MCKSKIRSLNFVTIIVYLFVLLLFFLSSRSVFACCPKERSLLRQINEVKGHQVQKYVTYKKYGT